MTDMFYIILTIIIFLYGIVIGSFLNVCILRIPEDESIVTVGSHCMNCGHQLKWYDLFPLFSWLFLKGKCRYCGSKISAQYPIVELANGVLYLLIFWINGMNFNSICYCLMASALVVIAVIDHRTMLIPTKLNLFILLVGVAHLIGNRSEWLYYVIGFFVASLFLLLFALLFRTVTGKGGMGLGDVELMACCGFCIGWAHGLFAIGVGSILAAVVECIRMAVTKKKGKFPFGPYLAAGVMIAALWGTDLYQWYISNILY